MLLAAVVALVLERAEDDGAGGAGHRLVLDRVRDRDQRPLAQHLRARRRLAATRSRRRSTGGRSPPASARARAPRGPTGRARRKATARRSSSTSSCAVDAVAGRRALRRREPVALLPHADRPGGEAGALGHVLDRQTLHGAFTIVSTVCIRSSELPARSYGRRGTGDRIPGPGGYVPGAMTHPPRDPDPVLLTGATGYVGSLPARRAAAPRPARARPRRATPHPAGCRRRRRPQGRRRRGRGAARGARRRPHRLLPDPLDGAAAATSPPATARPPSTSARPRATPASSASSTSADSATRRPRSTCARATRSPSCSRQRVPQLVHVRAAMIIGPGSASFEMLQHLVQRPAGDDRPALARHAHAADRDRRRRPRAGRPGRARRRAGRGRSSAAPRCSPTVR